jgi:hypothetical protein
MLLLASLIRELSGPIVEQMHRFSRNRVGEYDGDRRIWRDTRGAVAPARLLLLRGRRVALQNREGQRRGRRVAA